MTDDQPIKLHTFAEAIDCLSSGGNISRYGSPGGRFYTYTRAFRDHRDGLVKATRSPWIEAHFNGGSAGDCVYGPQSWPGFTKEEQEAVDWTCIPRDQWEKQVVLNYEALKTAERGNGD